MSHSAQERDCPQLGPTQLEWNHFAPTGSKLIAVVHLVTEGPRETLWPLRRAEDGGPGAPTGLDLSGMSHVVFTRPFDLPGPRLHPIQFSHLANNRII